MITKNFKNLLAMILESAGTGQSNTAILPVKNVDNQTKYLSPNFGSSYYPYYVTRSVASSLTSGIHIGSGDTLPTEDDYKLETQITSGISAGSATVSISHENGNPYVNFIVTLTNTTANDIVIKEVGFAQTLYCGDTQGASATTNTVLLLDRTVLENPLTVPANNGTAVLKYTLKTIINTPSVS